jgi:cation diffusion facilitator CzcD-associated flavoprotein CzcO
MAQQDHQVTSKRDADVDAAVIGAGFAGLYMLHRLRDHNGLSVTVFEASDGVGGTWHLNRYPGARCDTESYIYCYSFSSELYQEWDWSGKYPAQDELLRYLNHVADRFDLRRDIRLNTRVSSASWSDADQLWHLETEDGDHVTARFLITGVGLLASAPYTPDIPGLDRFEGEWYHTGDWPQHEVQLAGKRVGIIGTGSTGVQMVPVVAEIAEHLTVFQRTAQFAIQAQHHTIDAAALDAIKQDEEGLWQRVKWSIGGFPCDYIHRSALDDTPEQREAIFEEMWAEGGLPFVVGSYRDILSDRRCNDFAAEFIRSKIRARIDDPRTRELLLPRDHPFGSKRPIVETFYYEAFNRDNVELADIHSFPIVEITPTGIRTEERHYELDTIIFATGFDAVTGPFLRLNLTGRDGLRLGDKWAVSPSSYLGLATTGFPNLFMISGPGSTFGNMPVVIEHHVEWISGIIARMDEAGDDIVEASSAAEVNWTEQMVNTAMKSVIPLSDSWSTGSNIPGKPRNILFYLGAYGAYRKRCDDVADDDYRGFEFSRALTPATES